MSIYHCIIKCSNQFINAQEKENAYSYSENISEQENSIISDINYENLLEDHQVLQIINYIDSTMPDQHSTLSNFNHIPINTLNNHSTFGYFEADNYEDNTNMPYYIYEDGFRTDSTNDSFLHDFNVQPQNFNHVDDFKNNPTYNPKPNLEYHVQSNFLPENNYIEYDKTANIYKNDVYINEGCPMEDVSKSVIDEERLNDMQEGHIEGITQETPPFNYLKDMELEVNNLYCGNDLNVKDSFLHDICMLKNVEDDNKYIKTNFEDKSIKKNYNELQSIGDTYYVSQYRNKSYSTCDINNHADRNIKTINQFQESKISVPEDNKKQEKYVEANNIGGFVTYEHQLNAFDGQSLGYNYERENYFKPHHTKLKRLSIDKYRKDQDLTNKKEGHNSAYRKLGAKTDKITKNNFEIESTFLETKKGRWGYQNIQRISLSSLVNYLEYNIPYLIERVRNIIKILQLREKDTIFPQLTSIEKLYSDDTSQLNLQNVWMHFETSFYKKQNLASKNLDQVGLLREESILILFFVPEMKLFLYQLNHFINTKDYLFKKNNEKTYSDMCEKTYEFYRIIRNECNTIVCKPLKETKLFINHLETCLNFNEKSYKLFKSFDAKQKIRSAIYEIIKYYTDERIPKLYQKTFKTKVFTQKYYNTNNKLALILFLVPPCINIKRMNNCKNYRGLDKQSFDNYNVYDLCKFFLNEKSYLKETLEFLNFYMTGRNYSLDEIVYNRNSITDAVEINKTCGTYYELKIRQSNKSFKITVTDLLNFIMYGNLVHINDLLG